MGSSSSQINFDYIARNHNHIVSVDVTICRVKNTVCAQKSNSSSKSCHVEKNKSPLIVISPIFSPVRCVQQSEWNWNETTVYMWQKTEDVGAFIRFPLCWIPSGCHKWKKVLRKEQSHLLLKKTQIIMLISHVTFNPCFMFGSHSSSLWATLEQLHSVWVLVLPLRGAAVWRELYLTRQTCQCSPILLHHRS